MLRAANSKRPSSPAPRSSRSDGSDVATEKFVTSPTSESAGVPGSVLYARDVKVPVASICSDPKLEESIAPLTVTIISRFPIDGSYVKVFPTKVGGAAPPSA